MFEKIISGRLSWIIQFNYTKKVWNTCIKKTRVNILTFLCLENMWIFPWFIKERKKIVYAPSNCYFSEVNFFYFIYFETNPILLFNVLHHLVLKVCVFVFHLPYPRLSWTFCRQRSHFGKKALLGKNPCQHIDLFTLSWVLSQQYQILRYLFGMHRAVFEWIVLSGRYR